MYLLLKKIIFVLLSVVILSGCYPERHPISPEDYAPRRPKVLYQIPAAYDSVERLVDVEVWFDQLMNTASVEDAFSLSLVVADESWNAVTTASAMAQSLSEPQIMYLALQNKGAFLSDDGGQSWRFLEALAGEKINQFVIDPQNASTVYALKDTLILKSSDKGEIWAIVNRGLEIASVIYTLSISHSNSNHLWLGGSNGIFYSTDAGQNWQKSGELPNWNGQKISAIVIDRLNPDILYVSTLGRFIYKSLDRGATWNMIRGVNDRLPASQIYDVAIHPEESNTLFAATINKGVYVSKDGGENWNALNHGLSDLNARILKFDYSDNPVLHLAGATQLFAFNTDSAFWKQLNTPSNGSIRDFYFSQMDESVINLLSAGIVYTTNDKAQSWYESNGIDRETITAPGTFIFSEWKGEKVFIDANGDTTIIAPFVYKDALAGYYAGFTDTPPVDPNPPATMFRFEPGRELISGWKYMVLIRGTFAGNEWRETAGAKNRNEMSLKYDHASVFIVK